MANTYVLINSSTVGSGGATSITFSSIPATYTDLKVVLSVRSNNAGAGLTGYMTFNGSTTGYSEKLLYGNGASALSAGTSGANFVWAFLLDGAGATANTFASCELYVPNYASANYKSMSTFSAWETNATTAEIYADACLWSNTAAITSISFSIGANAFVQYSTAYLYGIKNS